MRIIIAESRANFFLIFFFRKSLIPFRRFFRSTKHTRLYHQQQQLAALHDVCPQLVTSGVSVRPVCRRLRGAHLGRAVRIAFPKAAVLPKPGADAPGAESGRQGKVQSHVLGHQCGQLRVPWTGAVPFGTPVPLLTAIAPVYTQL